MRADRLLSLMLLLHARGRMTADELAIHLEVSERTIYRDIEALSVAGVPVYTQPGTNGGVFLDEHYRVTLTGLSRDEVLSLFVASDAGPLSDLGLSSAAEDTLLKLFAALPNIHRDDAERARQRFYIDPANWFQITTPSAFLPQLQQAVWEDRQVEIAYQRIEGDVHTRLIDPLALVAKANVWYLIGRKPDGALRNYRVSRVSAVHLCDSRFTRDPEFDLAAYWKESCANFERESMHKYPPYEATLRVHPRMFWYFPGFMNGRYEQLGDPDFDGWYRLRVVFDTIDDARTRVLGLGTHAEVVAPDALRLTVIETAQAVVAFYANLASE